MARGRRWRAAGAGGSLPAATADQANAVYDVLIQRAGASDGLFDGEVTTPRGDFVFHQTREHITEYPFQGSLGFGGKFWNYAGRWYVTAYPEDISDRPDRQQAIDATNAALAALKREDHRSMPAAAPPGKDGAVTNPRDDALRETSAAADK